MAPLDSSPSLTQMIRMVRSLVNALNAPLTAFNPRMDGLDWAGLSAMPSFVAFDPLAQLPPSAPSEPPATASPHAASRLLPDHIAGRRSLLSSPVNRDANEQPAHRTTSSDFPLPRTALNGMERSQVKSNSVIPDLQTPKAIDSLLASMSAVYAEKVETQERLPEPPPDLQQWGNPANKALFPGNQTTASSLEENSGDEQTSNEVRSRVRSSQTGSLNCATAGQSAIWLDSSASSLKPASTAHQSPTLTVIEQIVNQRLTQSFSSGSNSSGSNSSGSNSSGSNSSGSNSSGSNSTSNTASSASDILSSFLSSTDLSKPLSPSSASPSSASPFNAARRYSHAHSPSPSLNNLSAVMPDSGFEVIDAGSETPLEEMAETLALLVNDVLAEQARRHGVDLS